jgi:hypothetical protein
MPVWTTIFERRLNIDNTVLNIISEVEIVSQLLHYEKLDDSYILEGILQLDVWINKKPNVKFIWKGAEKLYMNLKIKDEVA